MAEAVFKHHVRDLNHFSVIDSAGTAGYHIGDIPDSRSVACCKRHGIPVDHLGQQLTKEHLMTFDWVLVMDDSNLSNAKRLADKNCKAQIALFGSFDPQGERIIADPYYGGEDGFEHNYEQILRCSAGFCKHLGLTK
jgi:low molecular weight phosphotyrosine protein phosphatase